MSFDIHSDASYTGSRCVCTKVSHLSFVGLFGKIEKVSSYDRVNNNLSDCTKKVIVICATCGTNVLHISAHIANKAISSCWL